MKQGSPVVIWGKREHCPMFCCTTADISIDYIRLEGGGGGEGLRGLTTADSILKPGWSYDWLAAGES